MDKEIREIEEAIKRAVKRDLFEIKIRTAVRPQDIRRAIAEERPTMQRLQLDGTICAVIDLTGIGKHKVTLSQWYGGIVYHLVESCQLEDKFDFDWQTWWQKNQEILDSVMFKSL